MDSDRPLLIRLDAAEACDEQIVGDKAAKLAQLARSGFNVPRGFCLTIWLTAVDKIPRRTPAADLYGGSVRPGIR